jgi:hypothetical protein
MFLCGLKLEQMCRRSTNLYKKIGGNPLEVMLPEIAPITFR